MARDSVAAKERELTEMVNKQIRTIQSFVDENVEDMVQERKVTLAKYEKQFASIKQVCAKYFDRYDSELEAVGIRVEDLH
jgi:hypothetical protein